MEGRLEIDTEEQYRQGGIPTYRDRLKAERQRYRLELDRYKDRSKEGRERNRLKKKKIN